MSARQNEYRRYLQSAWWQKRRAQRLATAGHRCEFCPIIGEWHPRHGPHYGDRCSETRGLNVHHLHYRSLGAEQDQDLEVVCVFHHLVRHAEIGCECAYCGETVEVDEEIAIDRVREAIAAAGSIEAVTMDDIRSPDNVCDYCDHVWSKDD